MLADHRKGPTLTMVNSLSAYFGAPVQANNLAQAMQAGVTEQQIRSDALALTLNSDLLLFGVTKQLAPHWQAGADIQVSRTSGTQAAGDEAFKAVVKKAEENGIKIDPLSFSILQATQASGNTWTYHAQVVGSDTIFKNDTTLIGVNYTDAPKSKNQSIVFSNSMAPSDNWRLDNSIRLMRLEILPSTISYAISPSSRVSYRLRDKATLEAEVGFDIVNTNSASGHSRSFRDFTFVGYRLDI